MSGPWRTLREPLEGVGVQGGRITLPPGTEVRSAVPDVLPYLALPAFAALPGTVALVVRVAEPLPQPLVFVASGWEASCGPSLSPVLRESLTAAAASARELLGVARLLASDLQSEPETEARLGELADTLRDTLRAGEPGTLAHLAAVLGEAVGRG